MRLVDAQPTVRHDLRAVTIVVSPSTAADDSTSALDYLVLE
jgi:hypothetical protein